MRGGVRGFWKKLIFKPHFLFGKLPLGRRVAEAQLVGLVAAACSRWHLQVLGEVSYTTRWGEEGFICSAWSLS